MSLFDQLGKIVPNPVAIPGVNPGAQAVTAEKQPTYLDRLEQTKSEVEQRLSGLFTELGKAYYEGHAEDDHQTEYEAQLASIRDAYADIAQCEKHADEIAARRRCPACGAELVEGSMFCNFCGTKLPDPPIQPAVDGAEAQRLCPKCHAVLKPDDMFCTSCGANLRM